MFPLELKQKISKIVIQQNMTIVDALKQMDEIGKKLLLVFDNTNFMSIVSIGDIQRAIINNYDLKTPLYKILRQNVRVADEFTSINSIKKQMFDLRIECMPVVNSNNELMNVHFWEELFTDGQKRKDINLDVPVVIMAGGKGTRLKPLTNILPKPLIPIGDKTVIENIMDNFVKVGCDKFFLSVNYKANLIKHYFETLNNSNYKIYYFEENKPQGTAGSLSLLKNKIDQTFFVSNCDIIIDAEYDEILDYHQNNANELTIVSAFKHFPIAYGTLETRENGNLVKLVEKPDLTFQINSGMYILEPKLLGEIPQNRHFHITDLIEQILNRGGNVGVFPINGGSWKDIGTWSEYINLIKSEIN